MKKKFLALALSGAIMVMGAGYAAWTETATITNNTCTGELDIALGAGNIQVFEGGALDTTVDGLARTATAVVNAADDNQATVTVDNLYPGARVKVSVPVSNTGTIPAAEESALATIDSTLYPWLTLSAVDAPDALDVTGAGATGNIEYYFDVNDDAPENGSATFTVTANYKQFNK